MNTIAPQLPTVLGSFAAMLVAFLSLLNGTSPATCLMKAAAAFLVFAGFGLVLRYVLLDSLSDSAERQIAGNAALATLNSGLDIIVPGTPIGDLLPGGPYSIEDPTAPEDASFESL